MNKQLKRLLDGGFFSEGYHNSKQAASRKAARLLASGHYCVRVYADRWRGEPTRYFVMMKPKGT